MEKTLDGKKVIVVGGSSGIGLAVARESLVRGAEIVIASRSEMNLQQAAIFLGGRVGTVRLDAADEAAVVEFFGKTGPFDHLVATIKPRFPDGPVLEQNTAEAHAALESKFWGQYHLAKHGAGYIRQGGSMTLTSGIASRRAYPGFAMTGAINAAVEALCRSLAVELAPIRVNTVCPGFVEAKQQNEHRLEQVRTLAPGLPLDRLATADEVAAAYLFFFANSYATGTVLTVDGGAIC